MSLMKLRSVPRFRDEGRGNALNALAAEDLTGLPRSPDGLTRPSPSEMPSGQKSPKAGVGSPAGFARGAGRAPKGNRDFRRALPAKSSRDGPPRLGGRATRTRNHPRFEGRRIQSRNLDGGAESREWCAELRIGQEPQGRVISCPFRGQGCPSGTPPHPWAFLARERYIEDGGGEPDTADGSIGRPLKK